MSYWMKVLVLVVLMCLCVVEVKSAETKKVEAPPVMVDPPPTTKVEIPKTPDPVAVDKNIMASGNYLARPEAEGAFEEIPIAGEMGSEDVIWCRFWKAGFVGSNPVTMWKCKDQRKKPWVLLVGNDGRWWHGELDQ
jgi:hypothetical protein